MHSYHLGKFTSIPTLIFNIILFFNSTVFFMNTHSHLCSYVLFSLFVKLKLDQVWANLDMPKLGLPVLAQAWASLCMTRLNFSVFAQAWLRWQLLYG